MKVSLKTARLLSKSLDALINTVAQKATVFQRPISLSDIDNPELLTFEKVEPIFSTAVSDVTDLTEKMLAMVTVVHSLRDKVAAQNTANGIDEKVARTAYLNRVIGLYNNLIRSGEQCAYTETKHEHLTKVSRRVVAATKLPADSYGRQQSVQMQLLSDEQLRAYKKTKLQLTQELESIRTELARLNSKLEIELDESEVCVLEHHSLL